MTAAAPAVAAPPTNNELPFAPVAEKPAVAAAAPVPPPAAPKVQQPASPANFNDLVAVKEVLPLHVHIERALAELRDTPLTKPAEPAAEGKSPQPEPPAAS